MATVVRMPSVVAGATEAAIASWLIAEGDTVSAGTPIAEIETEKALVEYAAEEAGLVGRLVLRAGDSGEIGDPIAVLVSAGETDADIDAVLEAAGPAASRTVAAPDTSPVTDRVPATPDGAVPTANGHQAPAPSERIFVSPLVRKLAVERGIDLAGMAGTGPNGRIVRRDLERFLAADSAAPEQDKPSPVGPPAAAALIPHTPMRRVIARRLTQSKATVPHFYLTAECVVDELLALRTRVNETSPVKVSINDFVIAAAAAAFGDVPEANVTWTDEGLLNYRSVEIAIAVATSGGLVTPVLRGVEGMRISAIARESAALAQRARDRKLHQDELDGGTFTVSNLGMYGTAEFSAIINPPQSGILAVGAARPQPVVAGGVVVPATVMRCTLSVDHRAIDGALAARWLAAFTARVENPLGALI